MTKEAPMRIAFTRIPTPDVEEIAPARERRARPLKQTEAPDCWEGC